jgi:anti-sigma regulatory factor (Ser/Thr protein kinase)
MAAGATTATAITVSIARDPALVRTVRLVAAAVARRTGQDEDFVEEVRLAVGEACALMMADSPADAPPAGPVTVVISIGGQLSVEVSSDGTVPADNQGSSDVDGVEPWALLRGLIEDFEVTREGARTTLTMCWPLS